MSLGRVHRPSHFADLANPAQGFLPFRNALRGGFSVRPPTLRIRECYPANPLTITLDPEGGYDQLDLDVSSELVQDPDAQLLFGYTVQSLDYIPVPEPTSLSLALLGVIATLLCRARKTRT